jgi:three-Cys-motif partner protein
MMAIEFFRAKRPWSKYKDSILGYYLQPYIPKVAKLGNPILIVDCFAGCGRFGDGEPGSPLIIGDAIQHWRRKGTAVSGEFIEADPDNFSLLKIALAPYGDFAEPRLGRFEDQIDELVLRARTETVFLYLDPYTVKGLVFDKLKAVYDQIHEAKASVEVLMNFNVATFMRWALAALSRVEDLPVDATNEEADYQADDPNERLEIATLNGIAGGEYWQAIASDASLPFPQKLEVFTESYANRMRGPFNHVCTYPVKSKYEHQTPKYMLVYATRHPDGLELMNDAMCDAREQFLGSQFRSGLLFDMTPTAEMPNPGELKKELVEIVQDAGQITRKTLRIRALSSFFCRFARKDLNNAIRELLKSGKLFSRTGETRIKDTVLLSTQPFPKR